MSELKKSHMLRQMYKAMKERYGREKAGDLYASAQQRFTELCRIHRNDPRALKKHTEHNMFPAMAFFDALIADGRDRDEAAEELGNIFGAVMEKYGAMLRSMIRRTGIYKKVPELFLKLVGIFFTEKAGFVFRYYALPAGHIRVDVLQCPYCMVCTELGYPEIIPVFCHSDDLTYGNMHPKIRWNRTGTIGRGGEFCDFDLSLEE